MTSLPPEAILALPGAAASAIVFRHRRSLQVTVIAKATFAFAPDADMPCVAPEPVVRSEVHHGKNPTKSVRRTTDLAPYLARADVVFAGHAHATAVSAAGQSPEAARTRPPPGDAVPTLRTRPVRLAVFHAGGTRLDKTLLAQDPAGFQSLPITYERAFGGLGFLDNPFGTGAEAGSPAPNIVDPKDPRRPASFAPLGRAFPPRKRLLGSTPRAQLEGPIVEIPDDFDWTYFQAAPPDQRIDALTGTEWLVLEGLHPTLPLLRTRLPSARGLSRVYGLGQLGVAEGQMLELTADTLRIDGDEQRCTVVWRRSFPIPGEAALASLRIVAGVEVGGAALRWEEASLVPGVNGGVTRSRDAGAPRAVAPGGALFAGTMVAPGDREPAPAAPAVLPFQHGSSALAQGSASGAVPRSLPFGGTLAQAPEENDSVAARIVLPFAEKPVLAPLPVALPALSVPVPSPPVIVSPVALVEEPPAMVPVPAMALDSPPAPVKAPVAEPPPAPVKAPVVEPSPAKAPSVSDSPWASSPTAEPVAPAPRQVRAAPPQAASPSLKKGLYGRFGS